MTPPRFGTILAPPSSSDKAVRLADVEPARIRHGMPWTKTFGSTKRDDPLLCMMFWEWQMGYMNSSLTNLRSTLCTSEKDGTTKKTRGGVAFEFNVEFKVEVEGRRSYANRCLPPPLLSRMIRSTYMVTSEMQVPGPNIALQHLLSLLPSFSPLPREKS